MHWKQFSQTWPINTCANSTYTHNTSLCTQIHLQQCFARWLIICWLDVFFREFKALIAKTLRQKAYTQVHPEHSGNNLIRFSHQSPNTLSVSAVHEYDKLREMSFFIFAVSVPNHSQHYCSSISPHFIQFHAAEWDNGNIIWFFFFFSQSSVPEFKASMERAPVWQIIIEGDIAWFWHIGNARSAIVISADGSPITFSCPCHLSSQCRRNITVQQRGAIAILLFHFTIMQIICSSYTTLLVWVNMGCFPAPRAWIPTSQSVGISKSTIFADRDIASECPSLLICYMNIKQLCVTVKAGYDL